MHLTYIYTTQVLRVSEQPSSVWCPMPKKCMDLQAILLLTKNEEVANTSQINIAIENYYEENLLYFTLIQDV